MVKIMLAARPDFRDRLAKRSFCKFERSLVAGDAIVTPVRKISAAVEIRLADLQRPCA